ncbi:TonB-dependent receptor [Pandoraea sp. ISTKB]|uniref:TonB-dependent receptor n=1 Tax=Pandoraea sp. ISTKB TaxID=1586708 RepID=UPI00147D5FBA|nr:TonB-dependent receptor [Pandoraea sp. ISTKB]
MKKTPGAFRWNPRPWTLCSLFLIAQASHAAQNEPSDVALSAVNVTGDSVVDDPARQPFGVTSIGAKAMAERRLETVQQVLQSTPGISVNTSAGALDNNVYIRGVGSLYQSSSDDLIYGLSIDGVQVPSRYLTLGTLDVANISVLKGPQGMATSASGAAGLIDIERRRPNAPYTGYLRTEVGQDGNNLEEAAFGGRLVDGINARIAFRHSGEHSWVNNSRTGDPISKPDDLSYRASLGGTLGSRNFFELNASQQWIEQTPNLLVLRPYGQTPQLDLPSDVYKNDKQKLGLYSLRVGHDFDGSRVSATSGYTTMDFSRVVAYDQNLYQALYGMPSSYWQTYRGTEHVFSQDLRWESLPGATIAWNLGGYFSRGTRSNNTANNPPATGDRATRDYETRRYAVYGEVSYPILDALTLTTGLRHEWTRREYDGRYGGFDGSVTPDHRSLDDSFTTGRIGLDYALTSATHLYGSYARGYNPAAFQDYAGQVADSAPYQAAQINAYELGFKSASSDRRFELNGALFFTTVKNNQLLVYNTNTFVSSVVNVDSRSKGAELGGTWRPLTGLTLSASVAYTNAQITQTLETSSGTIATGNRVPDVARWSASLQAQYQHALPAFAALTSPVLRASVSYFVASSRAADPQNHFDLGGYGKLDMRIGLRQGRGEAYVWADNLLDRQYDLYGYYGAPGVTYGAPSRRRIIGIGFQYEL